MLLPSLLSNGTGSTLKGQLGESLDGNISGALYHHTALGQKSEKTSLGFHQGWSSLQAPHRYSSCQRIHCDPGMGAHSTAELAVYEGHQGIYTTWQHCIN